MTNLKIKTMTREEQIREASIDYQMSTNPRAIAGDAFYDFARAMNVNQSFIAGAKWADKTMIEKACEWIEENVSDYEDIYYEVGGYVSPEFLIKKFIEEFKKAMEG